MLPLLKHKKIAFLLYIVTLDCLSVVFQKFVLYTPLQYINKGFSKKFCIKKTAFPFYISLSIVQINVV